MRWCSQGSLEGLLTFSTVKVTDFCNAANGQVARDSIVATAGGLDISGLERFLETFTIIMRSVGLASGSRQHLLGYANRIRERFLFDAIPSYRGSSTKSSWRDVSQ